MLRIELSPDLYRQRDHVHRTRSTLLLTDVPLILFQWQVYVTLHLDENGTKVWSGLLMDYLNEASRALNFTYVLRTHAHTHTCTLIQGTVNSTRGTLDIPLVEFIPCVLYLFACQVRLTIGDVPLVNFM